jgi:hypothetical protein
LRYGSSAYVLITVTAKDQTKLDSIKGEFHANLGLNIEELGVRFDTIKADLVTDFLSNIDGHDAEATLDISVFGLNPDIQALAAELEGLHAAWSGDDNVVVPTSPNQPVSRTNTRPGTSPLPRATSTTSTRPQPKQPIDSVTFDKIGQILKAVRDTVERDLCRDQRSCEGTDRGPGFHDNHRTAAVTGIKIGNYEQLWGTPSGAMRQFREPIENLKAFVEPYAAVEDRIKRVYQGEIGEFLLQMTDQESSGEALYNYEIGTPAFTIEELNENAKSWEAKFGVEGSVYKPLRETILRCRDEALAGLDAECMTKTGPELEPLLAARLAGEAALGEYATMGRILPMNVALIGETVGFTDAKAKCAELGYRLPFANEADRIANAVAYSGDLASNSIWVAEAECGAQATMSFAPGASEPTIACGTGSAEVACVAPSGPVPLLAYDP